MLRIFGRCSAAIVCRATAERTPKDNRRGETGANAHLDPRTAEGKDKLQKLQRIDRYYLEVFVRMLQQLKSTPEGDGTLLDNCMIVYGSGLAWGRLHNRENVPVLLAGGGGGTIHGGRHINYGGRPLADLYLALLERLGIERNRVADSTGPLPQLTT